MKRNYVKCYTVHLLKFATTVIFTRQLKKLKITTEMNYNKTIQICQTLVFNFQKVYPIIQVEVFWVVTLCTVVIGKHCTVVIGYYCYEGHLKSL